KQKKKEADITWQHCESVPPNRLQVKCKYCSHACWGGIARMKHHLAGTKINVSACTSVPDDVKEIFVKLLESKDKKKKEQLDCLEESKWECFLKSIDTSDVIKDGQKRFELLDSIVEEIREENVVQVVTNDASNLVAVGRMLMEKRTKLFWSPCAAHCLDLVLSTLESFQYSIIPLPMQRKSLPTYIGIHGQYSKGRELARPTVTRFATSYLTLNCIKQQKNVLRSIFASEVLIGLYETLERMVPDRRTRFAMDQQLEKFKGAKGLFGMNMAIDTRDKKQP
ncbi:hypothetical protein CR513_57326, partial [Mucuna pruriens]